MRSHILPPPEPVAWTSPIQATPCVHDWRHAGVRWWLDASDPLLTWIKYLDQYHCRRCLEVDGRPIDYRTRLGDLPPAPGTFAVDSTLGARLQDEALAKVSAAAAVPGPAKATP